MIIWLNGAIGAGKTQTAYALRRRLPGSYVYDPENAGYFLRANLPPALRPADFQDLPLWRALTVEMLRFLAEHHDGDLIVPMTVTNRAYYDEIIGGLSKEYEVRHLILCATRETLKKRLASRLEGRRSWGALQMERCLRAFEEDITEQKLLTDGLTVEQAAERAAEAAGLTLPEDRRSGPRKAFDRVVTQIRHIR